ncbi:hypothetical protein VCR29J2_410100 [Vibrio coralliirubri]|nr:hypothetical protein VCR29J2_410100 [Vibrio coralliirubri]
MANLGNCLRCLRKFNKVTGRLTTKPTGVAQVEWGIYVRVCVHSFSIGWVLNILRGWGVKFSEVHFITK